MKVYLDNSATSWPKPPAVVAAISDYLTNYGASPGRSGHEFSIKAAREVFETRELISDFFNLQNSEQVVFSANATHALNIAIKGILKKGDHVIITHMEHNSVRRPLSFLQTSESIELSIIDCDLQGNINIEQLKSSFKPNTKLVISIHGSNASGTIMPIGAIGEICKSKGVLFLVDAAQTAGFVPIDMQQQNIDILAFTGHKKLYGPPGIGGLCINTKAKIETLIHGGTGSKSEIDSHPEFYPDCLEAGTINTVGVVGLKSGIQYVLGKGIESIQTDLTRLTNLFIDGVKNIEGLTIYGPKQGELRLPLVSLNIENITSSQIATLLDKNYGIMVRAGLHCSPLAHKSIGSFPQGTVRFSFGCFTTDNHVKQAITALKEIAANEKLRDKN
jgi:cysteine desulfurase family protein